MSTIIIADDHPVTLNGISQFVTSLGYKVLETYTNGISAFNNIVSIKPDYAILDISMEGMTGLEILEKVRPQFKSMKIVLYTMYHDFALFEKAKNLDVNGYVLKDFALEELQICLQSLANQKQWFSPRLTNALNHNTALPGTNILEGLSAAERKIVLLVAEGKTSKQIGEQLFISEKTVENHRGNVIKKLGLPAGKNVLALWAMKQNFS